MLADVSTQVNPPGKFIVIYGSNNLGKSTQTGLLEARLIKEFSNRRILRIKFARYDLEPTGPLLNAILREGKTIRDSNTGAERPYSDLEMQTIFAQNRRDYQATLDSDLAMGTVVVAEDYTGTGIAWGLTRGLSLEILEKINANLRLPDLAIMLDADKRFASGIEQGHRHESAGEELWLKNRDIHHQLAGLYNWRIIRADQPVDAVHEQIWAQVNKLIRN